MEYGNWNWNLFHCLWNRKPLRYRRKYLSPITRRVTGLGFLLLLIFHFFKKGVMIYSYTHYIWIPILKHPNQVLKSDSRAGTPLSQAYVLASTRSFTAKVSSTRGRKGTRRPRALFSPGATTTCYLWPFKKLSCSLKNLFGYLRCRTFQLLPILEFHLLLLAHLVTKLTFLKT